MSLMARGQTTEDILYGTTAPRKAEPPVLRYMSYTRASLPEKINTTWLGMECYFVDQSGWRGSVMSWMVKDATLPESWLEKAKYPEGKSVNQKGHQQLLDMLEHEGSRFSKQLFEDSKECQITGPIEDHPAMLQVALVEPDPEYQTRRHHQFRVSKDLLAAVEHLVGPGQWRMIWKKEPEAIPEIYMLIYFDEYGQAIGAVNMQ